MRDINKYAKDLLEVPFEQYQVAYRRKKVLEILSKYPHMTILEIGCGADPLLTSLNDFNEFYIIEPSQLFCKKVNKIIEKSDDLNSRVHVTNDFLENCIEEHRGIKFDFIILSSLLHEIEDVSYFLQCVHLLLHGDTVLHVNVPNAYSFHRLLALEMGIVDSILEFSPVSIKMQHNRVFSLEILSELLISHKFRVIESGSYFIKPFTHNQMNQMLDLRIINTKVLDGLFGMTKYFPDMGSEIFVNCSIQ